MSLRLMAEENPTWGYTRNLGALKNVGHRVSRSSIARILKAHGIPSVPKRPTSWQTFLRAHGGATGGANFFTAEVWTWRGLVTHYTVLRRSALIGWCRSASGTSDGRFEIMPRTIITSGITKGLRTP